MKKEEEDRIGRVAFIGGHLPRQCGIATFTTDLAEAFARAYPEITSFAVPVSDVEEAYDYPPSVRFEFLQHDLDSYKRAADYLNLRNVDLVCVQHEFGIFGGEAGEYILDFLRELRMPVVTTLHTIMREPSEAGKRVMTELARLSNRLVVMSKLGSEFLRDIYQVSPDKIDFIPHGIPDVSFIDPNYYKDEFEAQGRHVMLTFGLLSPNKGVEYAIEALPKVVDRRPDLMYLVVGATHPHIRKKEGEVYRESLEKRVKELNLEDHVRFHNRFVSMEELLAFIGAADIYITPYVNEQQITSGTLAYAVGAGKAVISTPYWYAEELLADGRGLLAPFKDADAVAEKINWLLENETARHAMRKKAYVFGREMVWPRVAAQYMESFEKARGKRERASPGTPAQALRMRRDLPLLNLNHLYTMTDDTGLLHHATYSTPNYHHGYSTDDNARALIAAVMLEEMGKESEVSRLASRYLAFLRYAFDEEAARFRGILGYDHRWREDEDSEDCHGRAIWALGVVQAKSKEEGLRDLAGWLFQRGLPVVLDFSSPRSWAFAILGLHSYMTRFDGDCRARDIWMELSNRLLDCYLTSGSPDWPWFEPYLTYSNGRLPHALLVSGQGLKRPDMIQAGLCTLEWLAEVQRAKEGHFVPIGSNGFYHKEKERARFDQQPVEAQAMLSACLKAYELTGETAWLNEAQRAFDWFLGRNDLNVSLYDPQTGGCRDGLHLDRVNVNQGSESMLAFLLSLLEMLRFRNASRQS